MVPHAAITSACRAWCGRAIGALIALAIVLAAHPASAQAPPPEFVRAFQAGTDAYRLGDYATARTELERARAIDPALPGPHRFLAAVDAAESKWEACVVAARRAIEANPRSTEIGATRKLHDDCRAALGRAAYSGDYADGGALAVTANVPGAVVTVAGLRAGATPMLPRPIALGDVEVSVAKTGWQTAQATARILPGVVTDVEVVLVEAPSGPGDKPPPATIPDVGWLVLSGPALDVRVDGAAPATDDRGRHPLPSGEHTVLVPRPGARPFVRVVRISRGQETRLAIAVESRAGAGRRRRFGAIALGTAAGLGAVGAVTGLLSMRASDQARDWAELERLRPAAVPIEETIAHAPIHTRADIEARGDRARTLSIASGVSYALSAVALGAGIYLLSRGPEETQVEIAPAIGDGWGVSVRGVLP